jgi:hypothetical protein
MCYWKNGVATDLMFRSVHSHYNCAQLFSSLVTGVGCFYLQGKLMYIALPNLS